MFLCRKDMIQEGHQSANVLIFRTYLLNFFWPICAENESDQAIDQSIWGKFYILTGSIKSWDISQMEGNKLITKNLLL
ncbi:hypothetical protein CFK37_07855 [Virgibacillus phasianinus]|uniref:Uncharacterized protein n=1 Tax=Virgibacillus phasianinus TaxID=2017483 RepID=A0A220U2L1_9BACI|nr:hypothetical protein CFK37_07855 [Virgibacillus phasianinus]